jgi:hypothetical protein
MGAIYTLKPLMIAREMSPGRYGDGSGLNLRVGNTRTKSWLFRYRVGIRECEIGLGPYPAITLVHAPDKAAACRLLRQESKDPIDVREAQQRAGVEEAARRMTFKECAEG